MSDMRAIPWIVVEKVDAGFGCSIVHLATTADEPPMLEYAADRAETERLRLGDRVWVPLTRSLPEDATHG